LNEKTVIEQTVAGNVMSRKEREKLARQMDILNAARDLFISKGYGDTTLEDIARKAEFGKGTIYNYFNSKEELIAAIVDQMIDGMQEHARQAVSQAVNGDSREVMRAYGFGVLNIARENWELTRLFMKEFHQSRSNGQSTFVQCRLERMRSLWGILAEPIRKDIEAGKLRPVDPEEVVRMFDGMLKFYCGNRLSSGDCLYDQQGIDAVNLMVSIFYDGITQSTLQGTGI
jgi:TetR/AcrR family transcriptional regulator, repressor of fatR-cypB operon